MAPKHVLILFCDQLRADCIGAVGNDEIQTAVEGQTTAAPPYLPGTVTSPAYNPAFTTSEE